MSLLHFVSDLLVWLSDIIILIINININIEKNIQISKALSTHDILYSTKIKP